MTPNNYKRLPAAMKVWGQHRSLFDYPWEWKQITGAVHVRQETCGWKEHLLERVPAEGEERFYALAQEGIVYWTVVAADMPGSTPPVEKA